jgi:hypothetical protein
VVDIYIVVPASCITDINSRHQIESQNPVKVN